MDPTNTPLAVDGYSVTPSGYLLDSVTPSGYLNHPVPPSGSYDNQFAASGPADTPPVDVAALMAANQELVAMVNNIRIGYNTEMQKEMGAFRAAVEDDFNAVQAQRDAVRNENQSLAKQMAATIARLERLERPQAANPSTPQCTRDPRGKPRSSTATSSTAASTTAASTKAPSPKPPRANAQKAKAKQTPATPEPAQQSSKTPGSQRRRSSKPPRSSPEAAPEPATPPRSSHKQPGSSSNGFASASQKSANKEKSGGKQDSGTKGKSSAKSGTPRKVAEHQMLRGDIDATAQSFKTAFQTHIRFLWGCLDATQAPPSVAPDVVERFELRFNGITVSELRRLGQIGDPVINPSQVKVGISVEDSIRTKNRIVRAFFQLEEGALLHIKSYLAKLGINTWAVDYSQSAYSMYNSAMRMCAIDTFRFVVASTYYDFLRPDTRYIKDSGLLVRLYDHFVHRYMFDKWQVEIRNLGGNVTNAERNKISQTRLRLHGLRAAYLAGAKIPKGLKLLFHPKATSEDESTPTGSQALARPERSEAADQVIRAVEGLMVDDLMQDGKTRAANNRKRRHVPAFTECNAGYFQEIPKEMPIQYYDPDWFNNRPPQARAKIAPKLIVVFAPGSTNFFSRRGENALPVDQLTQKYGAAVFDKYDLDFGADEADDAKESTEGVEEASNADDEGEGDSVGSQDSDEDVELSDTGSIASFISNDDSASDAEQEDEDDQQDAASGDDMDGQHDAASSNEDTQQAGNWDGMEAFAAEYDIDMHLLDDEREIFGDGNNSDSD